MPQVDLETLVTACAGGGNDRKIACETLAADPPENEPIAAEPPDFPPESFWLSKDAEYDWFDRNAIYERKESTKGNSNATNSNPILNPSSINSNSQRLKSKASMIGLPKTQKAMVDSKRRTCKPTNLRLFPKRSSSVGKSAVQVAEPGSPKVSCMGRVRSKRCRRRSNSTITTEKEKPVEKQKTGFYSMLMSIFRSKKGKSGRSGSRKMELEEERVVVEPQRRSVSMAPGLGGMNRFASGRRSGSWTGEVDMHCGPPLDNIR